MSSQHGSEQSYSCPHCGRKSHNPNDAQHRYCGACHRFEDDPSKALVEEVIRELENARNREQIREALARLPRRFLGESGIV